MPLAPNVMVSLCCLLVNATMPRYGFPLPFMDGSSSSEDACSEAIGVQNEGYLFFKSTVGNTHMCEECSHLFPNASDGTCPGASQPGGKRAYMASRKPSYRRDGCYRRGLRGFQCLGCPDQLSPILPLATAEIFASASCNVVAAGSNASVWINATPAVSNYHVYGEGGTIRTTALPLAVGSNVTIINATIRAAGSTYPVPSAAAVLATDPGPIVLNNVSAPTSQTLLVVRPANPRNLDVAKAINVSGSALTYLLAASHVAVSKNTISAACANRTNRIVVQQFSEDEPLTFANADGGDTNCAGTVDLGRILSVYGSMYEIEFYNNGTIRPDTPRLLVIYTQIMAYVVPLAFVFTLLGHEGDFSRMWHYLIRDQHLHVL